MVNLGFPDIAASECMITHKRLSAVCPVCGCQENPVADHRRAAVAFPWQGSRPEKRGEGFFEGQHMWPREGGDTVSGDASPPRRVLLRVDLQSCRRWHISGVCGNRLSILLIDPATATQARQETKDKQDELLSFPPAGSLSKWLAPTSVPARTSGPMMGVCGLHGQQISGARKRVLSGCLARTPRQIMIRTLEDRCGIAGSLTEPAACPGRDHLLLQLSDGCFGWLRLSWLPSALSRFWRGSYDPIRFNVQRVLATDDWLPVTGLW